MQLKTYIEELIVGELSHANIAKVLMPHLADLNPLAASVANTKYPEMLGKLINAINLGLTQIYTELPLAEEELILITNPTTDRYNLTANHAVFAGAASPDMKWIEDSEFLPFPDNVIECLHVIDENGVGLATNDSAAVGGVFFPAPNIVQVPFAEYEVSLNVLYRANHAKIPCAINRTVLQPNASLGYTLPDMQIKLPDYLINTLTCFILAKYYRAIGSVEAIAQSQQHQAEYLNGIQLVKNGQLIHGDFTEINPIASGGWI